MYWTVLTSVMAILLTVKGYYDKDIEFIFWQLMANWFFSWLYDLTWRKPVNRTSSVPSYSQLCLSVCLCVYVCLCGAAWARLCLRHREQMRWQRPCNRLKLFFYINKQPYNHNGQYNKTYHVHVHISCDKSVIIAIGLPVHIVCSVLQRAVMRCSCECLKMAANIKHTFSKLQPKFTGFDNYLGVSNNKIDAMCQFMILVYVHDCYNDSKKCYKHFVMILWTPCNYVTATHTPNWETLLYAFEWGGLTTIVKCFFFFP